jgi:hypothetical protein
MHLVMGDGAGNDIRRNVRTQTATITTYLDGSVYVYVNGDGKGLMS